MLPSGPVALPGQRIGLLGGSFDPPHAGHVHVTRWALRAFRLDRVWWLVSLGNPLKPAAPAEMGRRLAAAREIVTHPRVAVTDIEARLGTRYTAETLAALGMRYRGVHFVWLMGADNLAGFTRWYRFRDIAAAVPFAVVNRPGSTLAALNAPAAQLYARFRIPEEDAPALPGMRPPAWTFLHGPLSPLSSTALRAAARKPG